MQANLTSSGDGEVFEPLSVEQLNLLASLKEKIARLEQQVNSDASFELKKLLLDAYLLDSQFSSARKLWYTLSSSEQETLGKQTEFKILFNSFNQTSDTEYQQVKTLFQQMEKE